MHIAVAGCGIAGLACAILLARAGRKVVVFDRFDAPQPVGSGLILQPPGLEVLDLMGLATPMRACGAPIRRLFGRNVPAGRVVLDVRYAAARDGAEGLGVHRSALFDLLFAAAERAGAQFETGWEVAAASPLSGDRRALTSVHGQRSAGFDLVIDALGARSPFASRAPAPLAYGALWTCAPWRAGFDEAALEQRYAAARSMMGVLPIGSLRPEGPNLAALFWSLKAEHFADFRRRPLDEWKDDARKLWPETAPLLDDVPSHDALVFARYAHRTEPTPIGERIVRVGDSWRCTSPQLGQGANMALLDAAALAAALDAFADPTDALRAYRHARETHVRLYQAASRMFTPFYQSDSKLLPLLRDAIVAPLSRVWPMPAVLAALVAGRVGAPLRAIERRLRAGALSRRDRELPSAPPE